MPFGMTKFMSVLHVGITRILLRLAGMQGMVVRTFLVIVALFPGLHLIAQAQQSMAFEQLSLEQGVGSNWVFDITEDELGFVWFGGFSGLTRHDGIVNRHYSHHPGDSLGLSDSRVFRLLKLRDGQMACMTIAGGLSIYNPSKDQFRQITQNTHPQLPTEIISSGVQHENDIIMLAGRPRSIVRFNPNESQPNFLEIPLEGTSDWGYFRENKAREIIPDPKHSGRYFIIGNFRIYTFNAQDNSLEILAEFEELLNDNYVFDLIHCVTLLDEDRIFMNMRKHGLHVFNTRTRELGFIASDPLHPRHSLHSICGAKKGGYWIGSSNGRLYHASSDFSEISPVEMVGPEISGSMIECIYETDRGELYLATNGMGVLKHHPSNNRFKTFKNLDVLSEGGIQDSELKPHLFRGILHPRLPVYYTSAFRYPGSIFMFNMENNQFELLNTTAIENIEKGNFTQLRNRVLIHNTLELYETDKDGQSLVPFNWDPYGGTAPALPNRISRIDASEDGRLFIAGPDYVCLLRPDTENQQTVMSSSGQVSQIWQDVLFHQDGLILVAEEVILDWNTQHNSLKELHFTSNFSHEIKAIRGMYEVGDQLLATSAIYGVLLLERKSDTLKVLKRFTEPEIISSNIYTARQDPEGNIWLSTNMGYERFDPSGSGRMRFGFQQNLPLLYRDRPFFVNEAGYFASNSHKDIVYGKIDELLHVDTGGKLILHTLTAAGNKLAGVLNGASTITLPHHQNSLEAEWSHTQASSSDFYIHEFRLKGLEDAFRSTSRELRTHYNHLNPGDYTFEVQIRSALDGRVIHALSVPIVISPPWWATWTFRLALIIALVLIVYLIFRFRVESVRKKQELISSYNQQLAEMEMQFLRAQMNPHFMFNSLNSIKHFILLNKKEEAVEYLTKFAQLIRSILQFSNLPFIALRDELATLQTYVELEQARFSGGFDFEISFEDALNTDQIVIQPLILQPYVENAIWHGLMHKESDRKLTIALSKADSFLVCEIIDNGIGREKSKSIRSESSTRKSMGLPISEKRMKSQDADASVAISDLYDDEGRAAGTRVTLRLPLKYRND